MTDSRAETDEVGPAPSGSDVVLELTDIVKTYRGDTERAPRTTVLHGVSLRAAAGEVVWLRGGSGSGKSSLLRVAGLLTTPDSGTVRVGGDRPAAGRPASEIRRTTIGFVFQQANLLPDLTVLDNLAIAGRGIPAATLQRRLESWGLSAVMHRPAKQVSGGEAQRVAFCRALVNGPRLLLVDEPTAGLDDANAAIVMAEIRAARERGCAVVVASHDAAVAAVADRVVVVAGGRLV